MRRSLRSHAPDVLAELLRVGAWENDLRARLVRESAQPGDEELVALHCRRPVFECVLRRAAVDSPLVSVLSETAVEGVVLEPDGSGPPRITGVRADGATVPADVVIDASGRRTQFPRWVADAGFALPTPQIEESGIIYYSRYFRCRGATYPEWVGVLGPAGTTDWGRFSTFFGDNSTFAIILGVSATEPGLRALKHNELYMRTLARFAPLASLVAEDVTEPITDVMPMGALQNVFRPPLLGGRPPVLGLHLVGDAYCHTNPLFAWGLCLGIDYGFELGMIIDEQPDDPEAQAQAFAQLTETEAEQCYRTVAEEDRDRSLTWRGERPEGPWLGRTFAGFIRQCATPVVMIDTEVARAVLRRANLLDLPDELPQRYEVIQRVIELQPELQRPPAGAYPTREEMLELLARPV